MTRVASGTAVDPARRIPLWIAILGCTLLALPAAAVGTFHGALLSHEPGADGSGGYGSAECDRALERIARLGADSVHLVAHGYQTSPKTPFIEDAASSRWSTNDARLERTIGKARSLGLSVILSPRLTLERGWTGDIAMEQETGWQKWFEEYERWIRHYARLAQRHRVDLFCVGTELQATTQRERQWRNIITAVRDEFDGPVAYAANWGGELTRIAWWDAVDVIGLQAYGPLHSKNRASFDDLVAGASEMANQLAGVANRWDRPALVTEVGYRSIEGCHRQPWRHDARGTESEESQALAYRAVVEAFSARPTLLGLIWAGWSSDAAAEPKADDFSVRGKLAQVELTAHWQDRRQRVALRPRGNRAVIACSDSVATRIGVEILRRGGNAADAAVATAFALAVTAPDAVSLGGGGVLLAYDSNHGALALDFLPMSPLAAQQDMLLPVSAREAALRAAAIPGFVAGVHELWLQRGSLPWPQLLEPAISLARDGFVVGRRLEEKLRTGGDRLQGTPMARSLYFRGNDPLREGARLAQPELARTLDAIARDERRGFYDGWVARSLLTELQQNQGIWTDDDFRFYRTRERRPTSIRLERRRTLLTMPAPASAGIVLTESIYLLKDQQAAKISREDPRRTRALIESLRLSYADRAAHLADPAVMREDEHDLLRATELRRRARMLPRHGPGSSDLVAGGPLYSSERGAAELVIMDPEGGCVALAASLHSNFGSAWVSPSTGVLVNDALYGFGDGVRRIRPGVRMPTDLAPAIVLQSDDPWLVLSAGGGSRAPSALLQALVGRVWDERTLGESISAPRLHHEWLPDETVLESRRQIDGLAEALRGLGYPLSSDGESAVVMGAERDGEGQYLGVGDPRGYGLALPLSGGANLADRRESPESEVRSPR